MAADYFLYFKLCVVKPLNEHVSAIETTMWCVSVSALCSMCLQYVCSICLQCTDILMSKKGKLTLGEGGSLAMMLI